MAGMNRREFAAWGGAAAASALLLGVDRAAAMTGGRAQSGPADPLGHVDPELRAAARIVAAQSAQMPPLTDATLGALRAGAPNQVPMLPDIPVGQRKLPVGKGMPDVTVYVINARSGGSRPAILHTHGGGYIAGTARGEVPFLQGVARELDCVIVTVEYRLAPETRYTGSVEDNYAALRWLHDRAADLGVDRARIALLGESAGGGHAARLAITARDRGEVPLVLQVLIYPMLDDRTGGAHPLPPFIGSIGWNAQANQYGWRAFLGQAPGGPQVPAAGVPARVADLSGLAPAFIGVGGIDLFVSEDLEYARRLTEAGVPTEFHLVPGAFHAFDRVAADTGVAKRFTLAKMNALRRAFGQPIPA